MSRNIVPRAYGVLDEWMAVPRDFIAMLYMIREWGHHFSINNCIEKTKANMFQCSPSEFVCHLSYRSLSVNILNCPVSCSSLDQFVLWCAGPTPQKGTLIEAWREYLTFEFVLLIFLRTYPRVRFALPTTQSMWEFHGRLLETSIPRYLAQEPNSYHRV